MTGAFKAERGFSVAFDDGFAGVNGCGKSVGEKLHYPVGKSRSPLLIKVQSGPKAFVLALGPDVSERVAPARIDRTPRGLTQTCRGLACLRFAA